ncbi:MAG: DUF2817 domain-containing protein [Hyphomicrobiales bacterium]|nr:DUF2817 domain-containing protein [Hyphomicrobiales bacterium]
MRKIGFTVLAAGLFSVLLIVALGRNERVQVGDSEEMRLFADNYQAARANFLQAAETASAGVESYRHPLDGPDGGALFTDVAVLGSPDADTVLLLASGTHGVEGFAGSAIQTGLLRGSLKCETIKCVFIHAINPYGFAHLRRFNEENVDINRNFIDHDKQHPQNPGYETLAGWIAPQSYWMFASGASMARLYLYRISHGGASLRQAVSGGQYSYPNGLFYGGRAPTWSNRKFREILDKHAADASEAVFIDFHTGLGPFGNAEIIINRSPGSAEYQRATGWWGQRVRSSDGGESVSTTLTGAVKTVPYDALAEAEVTSVTLEFGTFPSSTVLMALQADNWLRLNSALNNRRAPAIKAEVKRVFCPDDKVWKRQVWRQGKEIVDQAIAGLSRQDGSPAQ